MAKYDKFTSPKNPDRPVQVESAIRDGSGKNIENNYAKQNGSYSTMTVGMADNLTPYDESAGDDQDEPFILQATGTGNGTQPDFATGSAALMKEKQGNTVVVNQLVGDAYNVPTTTGQSQNCNLGATGLTVGHKYLLAFELTADVDNGNGFNFGYYNTSYQFVTIKSNLLSGSTSKGYKMFIITVDSVSNYLNTQILNASNGATEVSTDHKSFIDLTQWFNGDIPQDLLDNPSNFFRYYQGSLAYNTGTLVNANGRYLKTFGRNQWDEDAKLGYYINSNTGEENAAQDFFCSANFIKVVPNETYYIRKGSANTHRIFFYDKDKNYIGNTPAASLSAQHFVVPANCCYIKFWSEGETYNHDITISIYYEDESGYDQYYPYEELSNIDTGNEVLRSAGSVCDIKLPDGTITRPVGSYTFTGSESWSHSNQAYYIRLEDAKSPVDDDHAANAICEVLDNASVNYLNNGTIANGFGIAVGGYLFIGSDTYENRASLVGKTIYFELATPTEEQGTPYSENVAIDDFGSMDFAGTNGVPQSALIFYPVDYKAFVDTLYKYTDGTPSDIVLKTAKVQEDLNIIESLFADFVAYAGYSRGSVVRYNGELYICHTAIPSMSGGWTGNANWTNFQIKFMKGFDNEARVYKSLNGDYTVVTDRFAQNSSNIKDGSNALYWYDEMSEQTKMVGFIQAEFITGGVNVVGVLDGGIVKQTLNYSSTPQQLNIIKNLTTLYNHHVTIQTSGGTAEFKFVSSVASYNNITEISNTKIVSNNVTYGVAHTYLSLLDFTFDNATNSLYINGFYRDGNNRCQVGGENISASDVTNFNDTVTPL